jgi:hypothetical protein
MEALFVSVAAEADEPITYLDGTAPAGGVFYTD